MESWARALETLASYLRNRRQVVYGAFCRGSERSSMDESPKRVSARAATVVLSVNNWEKAECPGSFFADDTIYQIEIK